MSEPRTEAGKRLYQRLCDMPLGSDPAYTSEGWPEAVSAILAIEADAAAPDLDALRTALSEWDAIKGSDLADQFRAFIVAGKMADAIRALTPDKAP